MTQWVMNPTSVHEDAGSIPASLSGLRIQRCHELWCRLQTWFRFRVAVAMVQASSCSSGSTPSLGTSICCRGPKKKKKLLCPTPRVSDSVRPMQGLRICISDKDPGGAESAGLKPRTFVLIQCPVSGTLILVANRGCGVSKGHRTPVRDGPPAQTVALCSCPGSVLKELTFQWRKTDKSVLVR